MELNDITIEVDEVFAKVSLAVSMLQIFFIILKVFNIVNYSWLNVLCPIWISFLWFCFFTYFMALFCRLQLSTIKLKSKIEE